MSDWNYVSGDESGYTGSGGSNRSSDSSHGSVNPYDNRRAQYTDRQEERFYQQRNRRKPESHDRRKSGEDYIHPFTSHPSGTHMAVPPGSTKSDNRGRLPETPLPNNLQGDFKRGRLHHGTSGEDSGVDLGSKSTYMDLTPEFPLTDSVHSHLYGLGPEQKGFVNRSKSQGEGTGRYQDGTEDDPLSTYHTLVRVDFFSRSLCFNTLT